MGKVYCENCGAQITGKLGKKLGYDSRVDLFPIMMAMVLLLICNSWGGFFVSTMLARFGINMISAYSMANGVFTTVGMFVLIFQVACLCVSRVLFNKYGKLVINFPVAMGITIICCIMQCVIGQAVLPLYNISDEILEEAQIFVLGNGIRYSILLTALSMAGSFRKAWIGILAKVGLATVFILLTIVVTSLSVTLDAGAVGISVCMGLVALLILVIAFFVSKEFWEMLGAKKD